jgi:glyoxylase-like metal-dependent hydrolase (beta-lactamase superfamily II)
VLWDLVTFIDQATVDFVKSKGGLKAIVISHPHFYTTHLEWARVFGCPVYVCRDDGEWLNREDEGGVRKGFKGVEEIEEVGGEVKVIQCGGHFDGSAVLLWEKSLFIADTFMSVPVSCPNLWPFSVMVLMMCSLGSITRIAFRVL